ncbi:MAG: hypothetical protein K2N05_10760 [Muribaculaceae bacterium]|nr:hypothetical protein [Muribaculaceae bacterium]
MRKGKPTLISVSLLCAVGLWSIGCGSTKTEREVNDKMDSIAQADSIAKVEAEAAAAKAEQARLDSIREDSIVKANTPKMNDFITFNKEGAGILFRDGSKINSTLKGKGFSSTSKKVQKGNDEEGYWTSTSYKWSKEDNPKIEIRLDDDKNLITINFPDDKTKDYFIESVKSLGYRKGKSKNDFGTSLRYNTNYYNPKGDYPMDVYVRDNDQTVYLEYQCGG